MFLAKRATVFVTIISIFPAWQSFNHPNKCVAVFKRRTGDSLVGVDVYEIPVWMMFDKIHIVIFLKLIWRCLTRVIRRYPCIHRNALFFSILVEVFLRRCRDKIKFLQGYAFISFADTRFLTICILQLVFAFVHWNPLRKYGYFPNYIRQRGKRKWTTGQLIDLQFIFE